MRAGDIANEEAACFGKPLDGVRVLALEQMQALPFATQLLSRLGADVVKIEPPVRGDMARQSRPSVSDLTGHPMGATFLRNNLGKRSVTVNLKDPRGRDLVLRLAAHFDVVAENSKAGTMAGLGLAYEDFASRHPQLIYLSVSGFGNRDGSPYRDWPALAPVVEAMSGIYEMRRPVGRPPVVGPMGAVGDVAAALFATIGVLSALRHRDRTGQGQMVDIAMLDATVAITDIVTNLWSLGLRDGSVGPLIMDGFRASDGWFVLQVIRENQFETLSKLIGHSEWISDPRFASRDGWVDHLDSEIRPAVEAWAAGKSKQEACVELAAAGLAGGPCLSPEEVAHDPHLEARHMIVAIPRTDGEAQPVLVPGNPVKLSKVQEGPENVPPTLGQDTDAVLGQLLGMSPDEIEDLRTEGVL